MPSEILFIGDCSIGGLRCLLTNTDEEQVTQCSAREVCKKFGCLRSIRYMIVCLDCVSNEEIVTITDRAREALVPVLLI